MELYNYQDTGNNMNLDQIFPRQNYTTWEVNSTTIYYITDILTSLYKTTDKFATEELVHSFTYQVIVGFPDLDNDKIYFISGTPGTIQVHVIDLTNDTISQIGGDITASNLGHFDIFIRDGNLEFIAHETITVTSNIVCYRWVDPNWTRVSNLALSLAATQINFAVIIGTNVYICGEWDIFNETKMIKWDGTNFTKLANTTNTESSNAGPWEEQNRLGTTYDGSNIISVTLQSPWNSGTYYLYIYNISENTWTKKGAYNVSLMLDRNTHGALSPFNLEKGVGMSPDKKVYQIHVNRQNLVQISSINETNGNHRWVTDHFIADDLGNVFEYIDLNSFVYKFNRITGYMRIPIAFMTIIDNVKISEGMFITIKDTFTTAGSTSTEVIFEGYVEPFVEQRFQQVTLRSPADELKKIFPEGDYSGRSDEIISSLIGDYCKYVISGTLSNGTAMGQVHFNGDINLFQIFNEFALTDNFIWVLTPIGILNYNDGTVDSIINIAESDPISKVRKYKGKRAINYVKIKGTIAAGDQVEGDVAQNLQDQQVNGYNPFIRTISHLNTNALCTTTETNILTRWGTQPTLVDFFHRDTSIGVIQSGETITFQNNKTDPNIGSGQFLIKLIDYNAKNQSSTYTITDRII